MIIQVGGKLFNVFGGDPIHCEEQLFRNVCFATG